MAGKRQAALELPFGDDAAHVDPPRAQQLLQALGCLRALRPCDAANFWGCLGRFCDFHQKRPRNPKKEENKNGKLQV